MGTLLEGALVTGARWGAWAISLERCLAAAKALGDRSAEAWALHEIGTRALCVGDPGTARTLLSQAVALRESIDDIPAAAASRQNLALVLAPAVDESPLDPTPFSDVDATWRIGFVRASRGNLVARPRAGEAQHRTRGVLRCRWSSPRGLPSSQHSRRSKAPGMLATHRFLPSRPAPRQPTVTDAAAPPPVQTASDVYYTPSSPGARDAADASGAAGLRSRASEYSHLHSAARLDRVRRAHEALLRRQRRVAGTRGTGHRRGPADEHADVYSGDAGAHDDL